MLLPYCGRYWIGQAFKVPGAKAGEACIHKKVDARDEKIAGTLFGRGDYAIAVKWWKKAVEDVRA